MKYFTPLTKLSFVFILLLTTFTSHTFAKEKWLFIGDSITQAGHWVDYVETWYLLNEKDAPEMIDLALSGETISGLSEPSEGFPRACIHHRLSKVLEQTQPDVVISCYGMNCGIYHPLSEDRFQAYKDGVMKLAERVQEMGAELILLTPPPYAGAVKPMPGPNEGEPYGYQAQSPEYNHVLQTYADWILSLDGQDGIRAVNIRPGIEKFMERCYPKEPVHPNNYGHKLWAESFLEAMGKKTKSTILEDGIDGFAGDPLWQSMISLVQLQRETYDRPLMSEIGHTNPWMLKHFYVPMKTAEQRVKFIDQRIKIITQTIHGVN